MKKPGRQALFSSLEFEWAADVRDFRSPEITDTVWDERFNRLVQTGSGPGIDRFRIEAFVRPSAVESSLDEIERRMGTSHRFAGKRILVAGGSRGFGAVLAKGLALQGAHVHLNFLRSLSAAQKIEDELSAHGGKVTLIQADLTEMEVLPGLRT
jgi:hypothetical protein